MTIKHYTASDFSMTFDGVRYDGPMNIDLEREPEPAFGLGVRPLIQKTPATVTVEMKTPATLEAFVGLFKREPPGASLGTLACRVRYGGRKGRSAMRRLLTRALPIEMTSGLSRFRGKAVFLEDGEIHVRVRSIPWDSFQQLVDCADREMQKLLLPAPKPPSSAWMNHRDVETVIRTKLGPIGDLAVLHFTAEPPDVVVSGIPKEAFDDAYEAIRLALPVYVHVTWGEA